MENKKEQILLGSLLGDGSLRKVGETYAYGEEHCLKQKNYLLWKNKILKFNQSYTTRYDERRKKNKKYKQIVIHKGSKTFREYYELFYPTGKKDRSIEVLKRIELLGLAIWWCDDGCYNYSQRNGVLSMGLSKKECEVTRLWLKKKFNLNTKIHKCQNNYRIFFPVKETKKLVILLKSYVPKCMNYKLGFDLEKLEKENKKRKEYDRKRNKTKKRKDYRKKYNKEYVEKNYEKILRYNEKYLNEHREKINEQKKLSYHRNREKINVRRRELYKQKQDDIYKDVRGLKKK